MRNFKPEEPNQVSHIQISDPQKPWHNECLSFHATNFEVICYAEIDKSDKKK